MEKLNITKYLKDCPQGMKLNCLILDNLYFDKISEDKQSKYPIFCFTIDENGNRNSISFTENGCVTTRYGSKCVIFPEGKTTWEGFQRPFKDGDIVYMDFGDYNIIAIFKKIHKEFCYYYYVGLENGRELKIPELKSNVGIYCTSYAKEITFATEYEKELLFNAIKNNNYKWNQETKTLETLNKSIFKVGDRIKLKDNPHNIPSVRIKAVTNSQYILENGGFLYISSTDEKYILEDKFDVNTLEPFQKMLTRTAADTTWGVDFFGYYKDGYFYCSGHIATRYAVPYEGNEHLLKTKNECDDYYKVWKF